MKKSIYFVMSLFVILSAGILGCSSDDTEGMSENSGNILRGDGSELAVDSIHFFQEIKVPYIPVAYDKLPDWLQQVIESNDGHRWVNITVMRGKWNGQYVYNVHSDFMSNLIGQFYDQNGKVIEFNDGENFESLIYETLDWTCIVNYKYY